MNIKHKDLEIPLDSPFANCKLDRAKYADVLTTIVQTYSNGFVLAVNNKWGTGKTTFIKMWQQHLNNNNFKTLYFNAWENDFENNPLIALLGELKTLIPGTKGRRKFKSLTKNAGKLAKNILPTLAGAIVSKYIELNDINELIKKATEASVEILEDEIEKYSTKKNGLIEFRKSLCEFITELETDKPIVFIIDELDRCRPNYAVEVLENIKHFFNVPNIVFVLSIDKEQLSHAIRGVYGSENLNTDEYLRRFIDLEYQIPDPQTDSFCNYLFDYFEFNKFFKSESRIQSRELHEDASVFHMIASALFRKERSTLRQQEQIFAYSRIVLHTFGIQSFVYPELLLLLVFFRSTNLNFYNEIKCKTLSIEELNTRLNSMLPVFSKNEEARAYFLHTQAEIIHFYNNSFDRLKANSIISKNEVTGEEIFTLRSKNDYSNEGIDYKRVFERLSTQYKTERGEMDFMLKKIALLDNFLT